MKPLRLSFLAGTAAFCVFATQAQAGPDLIRSGPALTYGNVSAPGTATSVIGNPAAGSGAERPGFRFALIGPVALGYELGDADDFSEEVEDLLDILDRDDIGQGEAQDMIDRFQGLLRDFGKEGYIKVNGSAQVPFTPFVVSNETLGGTVSLDIRYGGQARVSFLDDPLVYNSDQDIIETESAVYVKGGRWREVGVSYGRPVLELPEGRLHAGVRLVHYEAELSKTVIALQDVDSDEDLGDVLSDEYDANTRRSSAFGLDVGVLWVASNYQLGATLANLNSPEFDYPRIGRSCDRLSGLRQANCQSAAFFGDRIDLNETYEMAPKLTVEGAWFPFATRRWMLAGSLDVNETNDPIGDPHRWLSVSGGYIPDSWLMPGFRAGFHRNFSGSELNYVSLGTTLFRVFTLDVAWTLDSVDVDGDSYPRSAAVSAGLELAF